MGEERWKQRQEDIGGEMVHRAKDVSIVLGF